MFGLRDSDIEAILGATSQYPEIEQVVIFGSRAKNTFRIGSDIDIAIKGDNVTENIVKSLSSQLNEDLPLPYFFDVVHYKEIDNQDLKEFIDRMGKDLSIKFRTFVFTGCLKWRTLASQKTDAKALRTQDTE